MSEGSPVATECAVFEGNVRALEERQPALAERLSSIAIPAAALPALGRDQTPTFEIADRDGHSHFLGHTSIPRARAESLVDTFAPDGSNMLVFPMGTGRVARVLLDRTDGHCAVFVYEPDPVEIRLALTVTDLADCIRGGRLIVLTGPDAGVAAEAFFADGWGYEFPRKVLVLPHVGDGEVESMRSSLERASARVAESQSQRAALCRSILAERVSEGGGGGAERIGVLTIDPSPGVCQTTKSLPAATRQSKRDVVRRIGVLTIDPRAGSIEAAYALATAAGRVGLRAEVSVPDGPDQCHSVARLQHLVDHNTEGAVLVNCGWGPLHSHVPDGFPAVTWLLPGAQLIAKLTDGFGERHVVYAATPALKRAALDAGVDARRVGLLEVGCDETVFGRGDGVEAEPFEVACFGDVADLKPESNGIELPTHVSLWKRLCVEAAQRLYAPGGEVLEAAEKSSGVNLSDESIRSQLAALIDNRVMPTMVQRAAVQMLLDAHVDVRVFGEGWTFSRVPAGRVFAAPRSPGERAALHRAARVVICPLFGPEAVRLSMEVALSGGCVVCRRPGGNLEDGHPQLGEVLERIPMFDSLSAMRKYVRVFLRDTDARDQACAGAGEIIADRHLMKHRMQTIAEALAGSVAAP